MKTKKSLMQLSLITIAMMSYCSFASAQGNSSELDTINVNGSYSSEDVKQKKVGETVKTATELKKQQVQDSRDLVRYETGVTVVEAGRFGSSGYAIRGVDENRVAITVDGLHQAESLSSEGFKELFEGYGNFNNTRNSSEIETLKQANIVKGANSVKVGNGALGGAVVFETKDARDYLIDKDWYVSYKTGYSTADNQNINSLTLAGRYKGFDALLVKTKRDGHELENYDYKYFDASVQGRKREKADPYEKELDSTLLKLSFQPNDNHRFTVMTDLYDTQSKGADLSYTLKATRLTDFGDSREEYEYRHNNDRVKRQNYAFSYENYSSNPFWDSLKLTYSEQKIETKAKNEDYCDGNDKCDQVSNPLGLKYNENNELVDKNGNLVNYTYSENPKTEYEYMPEDVLINWYNSGHPPADILEKYSRLYGSTEESLQRQSSSCFKGYGNVEGQDGTNCRVNITINQKVEQFDINGQIYDLSDKQNNKLFKKEATNIPLSLSCDGINCNKGSITGYTKNGQKVDLPFTVKDNMATITASGKSASASPNLFLPWSNGYNQNLWTDRSLNTKTKQINLDLTKYIELGNTQHNISYGALLSKIEKEMINRSGDSPSNLKWWALHPEDCATSSSTLCNKSNLYSFLIPVKATNTALYFANDFKINSYLSFDVGYRYDRIKYKPNYVTGVTPKIPSDMIDGLVKNFVNPYSLKPVPVLPAEPSEPPKWKFTDYYPVYKFDQAGYDAAYAQYEKEKSEYDRLEAEKKAIEAENTEVPTKNALARYQANIDVLSQNKKYSVHSYSLGMNLDPTDYLRLQFKYSKGFRSPTSDEIYFTFKHPDFTVLPNLDLEPESAKTQQVALTLYKDFGFVSLNAFQTKYDNFIDLAYQGERTFGTGGGGSIGYPIHQNVNREYAKVKGFDIDSRLNLGVFSEKLKEISLSYKLTYQKGKVRVTEELEGRLSDGSTPKESLIVPMNAIQPLKMVYGLNYNHSSGKFGFDIYVTHSKAKEAKDTYNQSWRDQRAKELSINDPSKNVTKDSTRRWRSGSYTIVDFIAYAKPIKNLTLQFGVYNLTNKKYITWDSARSIKQIGTSNRIDYLTGEGINRFYSPGRNFKFNMEFVF